MKAYVWCCLLSICCLQVSYADNGKKRFFDGFWEDVSLAELGDSVLTSDTMSVLYSTRKFERNNPQFLGELPDPNGKITIVLAICKNQKWRVYELNSLDEACAFLPKRKNYLFYVEGFGKNFPLTMFRSASVSSQYQCNVVLFDYPSYFSDYGVINNYYRVKKSAKNSVPAFIQFIKKIEESNFIKMDWLFNTNNVLFFHSMGNVILKEMMQKNYDEGLKSGFFNRVVLNNACVGSKGHGKWTDEINFSHEIFIHHNPSDKQLKGAVVLEAKKILGRYKGKPKSKRAVYVNFEALVGEEHNAFFNKPYLPPIMEECQQYYSALFTGKSFPFSWLKFLHPFDAKQTYFLQ